MRTKTLLAGMFWVLLGAPPLAVHAQPAALLEQQRRERAQELFFEAEGNYSKGNYKEALAGYDQAYLLTQEPLLLFNQAQCYRQLQRYQLALNTYQLFIEKMPDERLYVPKAKEWITAIQAETGLTPSQPSPPVTTAPAVLREPTPRSAVNQGDPAPTRAPTLLYLGAGTGALWASVGVSSLALSRGARRLQQEPTDEVNVAAVAESIANKQRLATRLGTLSDLALLSTVAATTGFLVLRSIEKTPRVAAKSTRIALTLNSVAITGRF